MAYAGNSGGRGAGTMMLDGSAFDGLSGWTIALLALIYFMAFFIRGIIGFGSGMPAVLGSAWILPPHDAVMIALLAGVFAQIQLLPQGFRDTHWKVTRPMIAGMLMSVVIGIGIFASLRAEWLTVVMGACLSVAVLADITRLADRVAPHLRLDRFSVAFSLAALSGLMAGVAGAGANYFLSFYIRHVAPKPAVFRATNIVVSGAMSLWRAAVTAAAGLFTVKLFIAAVLVLPAVYAGGWAGRRLSGRLSARRYFRLFQVLLFLASTGLIAKGLIALS